MKAVSQVQLQQNMQQLQEESKTLLLSTLSSELMPEISYTPCARREDGAFFVFISELAAHTSNMRVHPQVSVMFIRDERESRNLYARERLIWRCQAESVSRESGEYEAGLALLEKVQGNIVSMLRTLSDFHLFVLRPVAGSYVVGFGRAYKVNPQTGQLIHVDEQVLAGKGSSEAGQV
ncbi:MAG: pyridoxamine 5'-phosphate oxidase family protein [Marinobacterium sp.]|nr:pyridoxamine 5'-phosphate oxidase family protein [Marinobacterium sp.]